MIFTVPFKPSHSVMILLVTWPDFLPNFHDSLSMLRCFLMSLLVIFYLLPQYACFSVTELTWLFVSDWQKWSGLSTRERFDCPPKILYPYRKTPWYIFMNDCTKSTGIYKRFIGSFKSSQPYHNIFR